MGLDKVTKNPKKSVNEGYGASFTGLRGCHGGFE